MTRTARLAAAVAVFATVTACGGSAHADQPKPAGWQQLGTPGSDTFTWCDHGNRLYMSHAAQGHALAAVPQDPTCKETPR